MLGTSPQPEGITNPPIDDLLEKVDSKYGLVVEAAKRARQINTYTQQLEDNQFEFFGPLVDSEIGEKSLGIALREIAEDKLEVIPGDVARTRRIEAEEARRRHPVLSRAHMDEPHTTAGQRAAAASGRPRRVVVGVAGSIAAYKAPFVIRLLRQAGHEVKVVATESALRFIGAPALAAVSGQAVSTGVFDDPAAVEHVAVAEWAELVLVAPASADLLARTRAGRADDLLTATILATGAPVVLAPAMHTRMWLNPATRDNVAVLRERGLTVIEPDRGRLTGKDSGVGRMPEPEQIVSRSLAVLQGEFGNDDAVEPDGSSRLLTGRHVVISAGGTREPIDPVRFLGNRSSGRQGCAIARAVAARGARVSLVSAHVEPGLLTQLPQAIEVVPVNTALELNDVVRHLCTDADAVFMAAAVADYRPAAVATTKIKKHSLDNGDDGLDDETGIVPAPVISLVENPDILAGLVSDPPRSDGGRTVVVGFAAETGDEDGDVLSHGVAKAWRKGADLLAVNAVGPALGFGDVPNAVVVLDAQGREVARASGSKDEVARALADLVAERLKSA